MTATPAAGSTAGNRPTSGFWPVLLAWLAVALDGYDLVVLGAVIPTLDSTGALGFTTASLTTAATLGLVGVGIGAVGVGPVTDRIGRRTTLISCIAMFSVLTLATAFAPSATAFIVLRFLAGLGLGACLPTALTFISEYAGDRSSSSAMTRTMTGYHVGAVLTALLALGVIPAFGWEAMFVIGGVVGLLVVPVMWAKLPESQAFLAASEGTAERVKPVEVVRGKLLLVSIGLWVASFMGLLLVYGLNTWLPSIMEAAGYSLSAGLALLLTLNIGAVLGLVVSGQIADRRGNKVTVLAWFGLAAVALALMAIKMDTSFLVYAAVLVAGFFVFSAQVLVYAYVGHLYPAAIRGTALGMAAGVGRVGAIVGPFLGGALVASGAAYPWGFFVFAAAAVVAVLALLTVPAHLDHESEPVRV
ncbi:MFS transporter [Nocardioides sp. GXQ0305]|uniref:MFS transporter n=1 Tax=Nocardioides sp. GXQ0305 TaxID=3423912 RepID=UPI003D7F113F